MSLEVITQPTQEPVTLDEVKKRLRLTTNADDDLILQHITTARVFAEKVTRKSLVSKGYAVSLRGFPCNGEPIRLPAPPASEVSSITYLDAQGVEQTFNDSQYIVGLKQLPAVIVLKPGCAFPSTLCVPGLAAVRIEFTAGPADGALQIDLHAALEGVRQLAVHFYEHPEAISSESLREMPLGIETLLSSDKVYTF